MKDILIFLTLFLVGCGTMQTYSEGERTRSLISQRKDPSHVYSCGPIAIAKVLREFGVYTNSRQISYEIQKKGHFCRSTYSLFDSRARGITFRNEVERILKAHDFKMRRVSSFSLLDPKKDVAIVLIHKAWSLKYHWIVYPVDGNIKDFFGNCTVIDDIYLIEKEQK